MPDAYGNLTEEERLRALSAAVRAQAQAPGMAPGMSPNGANITPEMLAASVRDTAPQREDLTGQMAMAQEMMRPGDLKGVQAGNVYVAPTWSAALADAVRQGTGGYLAYKTGQARGELNREQAAIDEAKGRVAAGQYINERGDVAATQAAVIREGDQRGEGLVIEREQNATTAAHNAATLAEQIRGNKIAEGVAAASAAATAGKGDVTTYHNPENPAMAFNVVTAPTGTSYALQPDGTRGAPVDITQLTPWAPSTTGSGEAAQKAAAAARSGFDENNIPGKVAPPAAAERLLLNPEELEAATGLGGERWLGMIGQGDPAVQDTQRDLNTLLVAGVSQKLEQMEAKPVSDFESRMAALPGVGLNTQPYGVVAYTANTLRPAMIHEMDLIIDEATASGNPARVQELAQKKNEIVMDNDKATVIGAIYHNYPLQKLLDAGIDPELIEFIQLDMKMNPQNYSQYRGGK
jgi:hypothetical protein